MWKRWWLAVALVFGMSAAAFAQEPAPTVGARAAVVMDGATGRILFSQNGEEPLPMASTTKILTALITLEQPGLDDPFVVDEAAIRVEGSSMGLQAGDTVTLRTLACGMLLASGNDGANAAAVRVSGSTAAFAGLMNQRAAELGMTDSHFVTPSGLDDDGHYATAADMARLARAALQNPEFAAICKEKSMRLTYGNPPYQRWLSNHNKLLDYLPQCIGVKTGFTKTAGRCLASAVEQDGMTLICVTLNCPDDWNVHQNLYRWCQKQYTAVELTPQLAARQVATVGGTAPATRLAAPAASAALTPEEEARLQWEWELPPFLYAPVERGEYVGFARVALDGETLWELPLQAAEDNLLAAPLEESLSLWQRLLGWLHLGEAGAQ